MKGSLVIISFFILGTLCGMYKVIPMDVVIDSKISLYALGALMFSVGISVGNDPQTLKNFRSLNPRLLFLPVMTILGTLAGSAVVSLTLTHRSLTDCLAVGLVSVTIPSQVFSLQNTREAELGTIALLANISREILTFDSRTTIGALVRNLAPFRQSATTMDNAPYHNPNSRTQFVIVSIFHGFVFDFSVPFLVTLFCSFKSSIPVSFRINSKPPSALPSQ